MKKVLFVISYLDKGGAERALSNITTHFPQEWDIDILVNDNSVIDYPFRGNILTLGITEKPKTSSVIFQLKVLVKRIKKLRQLKKRGNYQACVSFLDSANVANLLSGKRYCRVILSVRSSLKQASKLPQYKYIVNPLARILYNHADHVVAVSEEVRKELVNYLGLQPEKVVAIENGYDIDNINKLAQENLNGKMESLLIGKKVVMTAGRLAEPKGQWHLIRAFTVVVRHVPEALLVILGTGELKKYLEELVKRCNLEDRVIFAGYVSNPYQYEKYADVFVLPSLYEGFPNALAEALCLGLPCVATDFRAGAREILAPEMKTETEKIESILEAEYGILTPICSGVQYANLSSPLEPAEVCLAEALIELLEDKGKREEYSRRSRLRGKTLSIGEAVDKWVRLITADTMDKKHL